MKRLAIVAAAVAALAFSGTAAQAHKHHKHHKRHKQVETIQVVNGLVAQGIAWAIYDGSRHTSSAAWGAYGAGVAGCVVLSPIVTTAIINRPLTMREAWVGGGNCALPLVGGWIVNAAFDANGWDRYDTGPRPMKVKRAGKKKK